MTSVSAGEVGLVGLAKEFGDFRAVKGIDMEIPPGTFFSLLGPSGCGKTTTLRMIAGFETPTAGEILLNGQNVKNVLPHERDVNTVFQSYALFPHLTVFENVAFGLRRRRRPKADIERAVADALEMVQLSGHRRKRPFQLSGGQKQRVALARALVLRPSVLLLDEPLGALDARLRKSLQVELKNLQREVGITFIYVTHDQEEALTMSDQIAVMNNGIVEQVGTPADVYERPATAFVAQFLGASNLMDATIVRAQDESSRVDVSGVLLTASGAQSYTKGDSVVLMIRPERVSLGPDASGVENELQGVVDNTVYLGNAVQVFVRLLSGAVIRALVQNSAGDVHYSIGQQVVARFPRDALRVLPDVVS